MSKANGGKKKRTGTWKRLKNGTFWGSGQRSGTCCECGVELSPAVTICGRCAVRRYGDRADSARSTR